MNIKKIYKGLINVILTVLFLLVLYYLGSLYTLLKYLGRIDNIWNGLLSLLIFIAIVVLSFIFVKYWLNFRQISRNKKIILIAVSATLLIYTAFPLIINDYCCEDSDCVLSAGIKCCYGPATRWYNSEAKNNRYQDLIDMVKKVKCFKTQCPLYRIMGMDIIIGPPSIRKEIVCVSNRCQLIFDCEEVCQRFNSVDETKKGMLKDYFSGLFIDKCKCE